MKTLLIVCFALVLAACNSGRPAFGSMSAVELAEYNRGLPPEQQVFCVTETSSSSFIRRRVCQSFEDWVTQSEQAAMTLDVLNSRPAYTQPSIQDGRGNNY